MLSEIGVLHAETAERRELNGNPLGCTGGT